jgi:hypothetical protein
VNAGERNYWLLSLIVAVLAGVIVAVISGDGRFGPGSESIPPNQAALSGPATPTSSLLEPSISIPTETLEFVPAITATNPPPEASTSQSGQIDISTVLTNIHPGQGGIENAAPWWTAHAPSDSGESREYDPSSSPGRPGCFGVAWEVLGYDKTVIVFQQKMLVDFQPGGWYVQVCLSDNVQLTAHDVGEIQAAWLEKTYGYDWNVQVIP